MKRLICLIFGHKWICLTPYVDYLFHICLCECKRCGEMKYE